MNTTSNETQRYPWNETAGVKPVPSEVSSNTATLLYRRASEWLAWRQEGAPMPKWYKLSPSTPVHTPPKEPS